MIIIVSNITINILTIFIVAVITIVAINIIPLTISIIIMTACGSLLSTLVAIAYSLSVQRRMTSFICSAVTTPLRPSVRSQSESLRETIGSIAPTDRSPAGAPRLNGKSLKSNDYNRCRAIRSAYHVVCRAVTAGRKPRATRSHD